MSHDFEALRYKLIEQQIRPWNVSNLEVLEALRQIPRETFVQENQAVLAFADTKLPLPQAKTPSQTMLEPKMEARLLQALAIKRTDKVLEVGAGSGYMAALLANFAKSVTSVDIDPEMVTLAKSNLARAYISNVQVEVGDAYTGWGDQSYDVICVSGGMPSLYEGLKQQLAIGGRLVAFIGEAPVMNAVLVTRHDATRFSEEVLFETMIAHIQSPKVKHTSFDF
ncbi:protein-L-isoaspartate O-methyltransferase [Polynucleobacter sp. MWH-Spelu-300-X4]|uniref:protein-L-isoaspartate O-methyltransferase family protein n=1 Tax=Polynucleobacter sp. MWH-Spelu-300-X4 TaxID=2689109 RepID=UPI001BFD76E8|nr:protein-L-isoaspartate O-methyltransferase [Polynucleobacter sp. MWH-Spelu-300-X4]QWD80074.1 protein-L-isoaspartate O-methyltransferase [Polynucleobacter sp. MWH-Spelu-300-X4]